jgi:nitrate reductase NapAB chaperone NapD
MSQYSKYITKRRCRLFKGQLIVVVQNSNLLNKLDNIKKIDGIDKVTRVYKNSSIRIKV